VLYQGTAQEPPRSELSRDKGQIMSHHDRDAEIAAFIHNKGVIRCPTACVAPTQGSPDPAIKLRSNSTELFAINCGG